MNNLTEILMNLVANVSALAEKVLGLKNAGFITIGEVEEKGYATTTELEAGVTEAKEYVDTKVAAIDESLTDVLAAIEELKEKVDSI